MFLRKILKMKKLKNTKLGRWKPTKNNSFEQMRKIDLANCDSCGTCATKVTDEFINYELYIVPHHKSK